jgi:hypothetical protein
MCHSLQQLRYGQCRCIPADEWIKRIQHVYMVEYNSAIKKNEIMSVVGKMDGNGRHNIK